MHYLTIYIILTILIPPLIIATQEHPLTLQTSKGLVQGKVIPLQNGSSLMFGVFYGIPYAEVPLGDLRFQLPQPRKPWTRTWNATKLSPMCPTVFPPYDPSIMSEDCLYLNVFTPRTSVSDSQLYPVMLWVHSGTFSDGSASMYPESGILANLVSNDILVVTINYRIGAFAFWSSDTPDAPGNYGLFDQLQALLWVREEIKAFGGDPGQITIAGESAGAAAISLLTLSPLSKGLYKQVILLSGSGFAPWAINEDAEDGGESAEMAYILGCLPSKTEADGLDGDRKRDSPIPDIKTKEQTEAEMKQQLTDPNSWLGLLKGMKESVSGWLTSMNVEVPVSVKTTVEDGWKQVVRSVEGQVPGIGEIVPSAPRIMVECMRALPSEHIIRAQAQLSLKTSSYLQWAPRYDGTFLPHDINELAKSRDPANVMIGTSKDEAASLFFTRESAQMPMTPDDLRNIIENNFVEEKFHNAKAIQKALQYQYIEIPLANNPSKAQELSGKFWFDQAVKMLSNSKYWAPSFMDAASFIDRGSSVYLFSFDYMSNAKSFPEAWNGITMRSLLEYIFDLDTVNGRAWKDQAVSDPDKWMREFIGSAVTNFVKLGSPTPSPVQNVSWIPTNAGQKTYLSISNKGSRMRTGYYSEDITFWNKLVQPLQQNLCN